MSLLHETKKITLPGSSTVPVLVFRSNVMSMQNVMFQCMTADAYILGRDKLKDNGYLFQVGQQRIYSSSDFVRPGVTSGTFEMWMCAASGVDSVIQIESSTWGDGI